MSRKYTSEYGATRPLTAAERLAEMMCGRQATKDGRVLPVRFWEQPGGLKEFVRQKRAADALLKLYDPEAVFTTLAVNPNILSLAPAFVADKVRAAQATLDRELERAARSAPAEARDPNAAPRAGVARNHSVRSKLKDI